MVNKDIIVLSLQSWDSDIGSNCINIAKEFAGQNRVLYVNRAPDRAAGLRKMLNRHGKTGQPARQGITRASENLWVFTPASVLESINWLPGWLYNWFSGVNARRFARDIREACSQLGFKDPVLFVDNDFFRSHLLTRYLRVSTFIYYIRDYLVTQKYFRKHGARVEQEVIEQADVVVANSSFLADYGARFNKNSYDIGQGCDFTYFNPAGTYTIPAELKEIKGPVVGYVGALVHYRLDISLLEKLAARRADWNWVFVGPEDEPFQASSLHSLPNVKFLGRKEEKDLASYVSGFQVCINPQLVNEVTMGNYPRKIDEYLAMGKPVVATYTDFMKSFLPWVHLCTGMEEYEAGIEKALAETDDRELSRQRQQFALSHTWESSVEKIYAAYNKSHGT